MGDVSIEVLTTLAGAVPAGGLVAALLAGRDALAPSWAGPKVAQRVRALYQTETVLAWLRLALWAWLVASLCAVGGAACWSMVALALGWPLGWFPGMAAGLVAIGGMTFLRLLQLLHDNPAVIAVSARFDTRRLHPLWRMLDERCLRLLAAAAAALYLWLPPIALAAAADGGAVPGVFAAIAWLLPVAIGGVLARDPEPMPVAASAGDTERPNILMIGCDTLRADRISTLGYSRETTPFLDGLSARGIFYSNCWVPVARTAPSLATWLTGLWPWQHGIRDNFHAAVEFRGTEHALPKIFVEAGYDTAAIVDWAGSDLGKYDFGFRHYDGPGDQWNLRYLIRQAPKDLRLFLSLFLINPLGRRLLPEIYYIPGVPLTQQMGRRLRRSIARAAMKEKPFFLTAFFGTAHPPFGSEYPWYTRFTQAGYDGPSRFIMGGLGNAEEIIRSQRDPRSVFDLDQIESLYDGCIRAFDEEVRRILDYIDECGLSERTIVVIFSDHGMEFFENGSWGQGNSLPGGVSNRVPLWVMGPGIAKGKRCDAVVSSRVLNRLLRTVFEQGEPVGDECEPESVACETGIKLGEPVIVEGRGETDFLDLLEVDDPASGTLVLREEAWSAINAMRQRAIVKDGLMLLRLGEDFSWYGEDGEPLEEDALSTTQKRSMVAAFERVWSGANQVGSHVEDHLRG